MGVWIDAIVDGPLEEMIRSDEKEAVGVRITWNHGVIYLRVTTHLRLTSGFGWQSM